MRLLADENIPLESVRALRTAGHDVFSAGESAAGAADAVLLERAASERRLVVTFDRDFGELAARHGRLAPAGVLLIRIVPRDAAEITHLLIDLFARSDVEWEGRLTVVDRAQLRQRPMRA
jgi:predicted nuclease of predicted toxin-antitoxin system